MSLNKKVTFSAFRGIIVVETTDTNISVMYESQDTGMRCSRTMTFDELSKISDAFKDTAHGLLYLLDGPPQSMVDVSIGNTVVNVNMRYEHKLGDTTRSFVISLKPEVPNQRDIDDTVYNCRLMKHQLDAMGKEIKYLRGQIIAKKDELSEDVSRGNAFLIQKMNGIEANSDMVAFVIFIVLIFMFCIAGLASRDFRADFAVAFAITTCCVILGIFVTAGIRQIQPAIDQFISWIKSSD